MIDISSKLTETITVMRPTSRSSTGDPVRSTFTAPARVERGGSLSSGGDLEAERRGALVFSTTELREGDLIFLSEDDTGDLDTGRSVKAANKHIDLEGNVNHYTVTL